VIAPPTLGPLVNSAEYDDIESELKQIFLDLFSTYLRASERDLNVYGAAHLGSLDLLTKRIKVDGLAVFGDDANAVEYLYRAWNFRNPKRGMIFLRTYLQLLWPNAFVIDQLWQQKGVPYPTALFTRSQITDPDLETNYYLTSRIRVSIDDASETGVSATRVLPALLAVLAARFLIELQVLKRFTDTIGIADGLYAENVGFFDGSVKLPFAKSDVLGLAPAAYSENIGFASGDMLVTLAGKTPPAQDTNFIADQALLYNGNLGEYSAVLITYLGYMFAATFSDTDSLATKISAVQDRIDAILAGFADGLANGDLLHQTLNVTMPATGYW
jgi:hypothetical protein